MKKEKTYLGKAPDLTQFSEIDRLQWDGATWVVFHKRGTDWQSLKVILLTGRRVKANYLLTWSIFRQDFADTHDLVVMEEHSYGLYDQLRILCESRFKQTGLPPPSVLTPSQKSTTALG
jgi:hypothetical protein